MRSLRPGNLLNSELHQLFTHRFLFKLAESLVKLFIPLYMLESGLPLYSVLVFYLIYYAMHLGFAYPMGMVASRLGYRRTALLASPLVLAFYMALRTASTQMQFYAAGVLGGLGFVTYWMGMNPELAHDSTENRETETGIFFSLPAAASLIGPLAGGLLITGKGFAQTFLVATLVVFLSYLPFSLNWSNGRKGLEKFEPGEYLEDFAAFVLKGSFLAGFRVFWPLLLATFLASIDIGLVGTATSLGTIAAGTLIGGKMGSGNKKLFSKASGFLMALCMGLAPLIPGGLVAVAAGFFLGLGYTGFDTALFSTALKRGEDAKIQYMAFREVGLGTGRVLTLIAGLAVAGFFPIEAFFPVLGVAGLAAVFAAERVIE